LSWLLELIGVWKRYDERSFILEDVNLRVSESSLVVVSGPNGSGKTTLIKISCGFISPTRGVVRVNGFDVRSVKAKNHIGVMLHEPLVYPELTVEENLRYYAKLRDAKLEGFALRVFESLGLERFRGKTVRELSYGWRKKVDFVRTLLGEPRLLLLDEPFSSIDPHGRSVMVEAIREYLKSGGSIVLTTATWHTDLELLRESGLKPAVYHIVDGRLTRVE